MTTQITLADYWMGRDRQYPAELTDDIKSNALDTVGRVNLLLFNAAKDGLVLIASNKRNLVNSGWRPAAVNAATKGAAPRSRHMLGQAVDISDPTGTLDAWGMENLNELAAIGLWMEHPDATPGWCHLQTVPPRSGNRVFHP